MKFIKTDLNDAFLIDMNPRQDARGFFGRMFCVKEFEEQGLETCFVQANNSFSKSKGTLRGLHYQVEPMEEVKLVRCIRGSFYDVIVDLRPKSSTFGRSYGAVLSAENRLMMYVPKGFAHGFVTLEDESEVMYLVSQFYSQDLERGIRWNDPYFNITWPIFPEVISERDQNHPAFVQLAAL
jgi:dTDP-4-dehydrorhamnose 3,5-epimerase